MEDNIKIEQYKISEFKDLFCVPEESTDILTEASYESALKINYVNSDLSGFKEDSGKLFENTFGHRDVILNEEWEVSENVQGKLTSLTETEVYIDCLIDVENRSFQHRVFPFHLFKHINGLQENKTVIIKTKIRAGSVRVDVYPGDGIVNEKLFELKDKWESLSESGIDKKLNKW